MIVIVMMRRKRVKFISFLTLRVREKLPLILIVMVIVRVTRKAGGRKHGQLVQVDFPT